MAWLNSNILSALIWCPVIGALLVALLPRPYAKAAGVAVAIVNFALSLHLWWHWQFDMGLPFQFEQKISWMPKFGIMYHLGVDGLSLFLVLLTTFLTPLVLLASWNSVRERTREYAICFLLLEAAAVGVFVAVDVILFYVFWEAVLIPAYLIIGIWGGPNRVRAGIKFFIYTMLGSVLMWLAILYLYVSTRGHTFDLTVLKETARAIDVQYPVAATALFLAFALAFAIKVPLFPFHTWLPDAYTEAPTGGTVMLAAVLSKMGAYGFLRLALPFFPQTATEWAPVLSALAIVGIIYGAMVAITQRDMKRLIAYSSVSHLGFIMLGVFAGFSAYKMGDPGANTLSSMALGGATLQMFNHGISTGALFLIVGMLTERRGSRDIADYGGLAKEMPTFTVLFWIALFASIGLPGLNGFVGEYLILQGSMGVSFWYVALATTGVILGAVYMLRLFRSVMFGELPDTENRGAWDANRREIAVLALLLAIAVWVGVAPQPFLEVIDRSTPSVTEPSDVNAGPPYANAETGNRNAEHLGAPS